jgi:hypothetical protein
MSKAVKELTEITPLNVPVPPMLAKAMGYNGEAWFVSFHWTSYGDEADYSDGRLSATGNWQAFLDPYTTEVLQRSAPCQKPQ